MMDISRLNVSLETVLATSSLLGHELEDRTSICSSQDNRILDRLTSHTSRMLRDLSQHELFCVAPLDILVSDSGSGKQFHLLELNGTGIGGLTNMPWEAVNATMTSLSEFSETISDPNGVVLLAVSGKESERNPRLNRLMHEKLLFVDAMRSGLERRHGACSVATLSHVDKPSWNRSSGTPTVVVGYIKELIRATTCDVDGTLWLGGRRVSGAVNDRFCRNLLQHFDDQVDLTQLRTLNRCFLPGSDKGVAYSLVNRFVQDHGHASLPSEVLFEHAYDRESLIAAIIKWVRRERQTVIKPHGTGLGHGIEFFLKPGESRAVIERRVDASLRETESYYGIPGGAFPYTLCEYVEACRIHDPSHALQGHKFELRVVVYRDGHLLRAMPSIAKIARERASADKFDRRSLINNVTASGDTAKVCGTDFVLPLCNRSTLEVLDLTESDLQDLCRFATGLVRHTLDRIQDQPTSYGLPQQEQVAEELMFHAA